MQSEQSGHDERSEIFDQLHDDDVYAYGVRKISNTLLVVGIVLSTADVISLAASYNALPSIQFWFALGLTLLLLAAYIGLSFWAKKKPFSALVTGLLIFCTIQVLAAIGNPETIFSGILLKAGIAISLVFWLRQAKHLQTAKKIAGR